MGIFKIFDSSEPADDRSDRQKAKDAAHAARVKANEDEVLEMAKNPEASDYVKEVAEDIQMRRANYNPHGRDN
jgi:hypothetical protein